MSETAPKASRSKAVKAAGLAPASTPTPAGSLPGAPAPGVAEASVPEPVTQLDENSALPEEGAPARGAFPAPAVPAVAAPLEAPKPPVLPETPAVQGPTSAAWAVDAAKQRRTLVLDAATRDLPDLTDLIVPVDESSHRFRVQRRLVQTHYFGLHTQPSYVLAFAAGRILSAPEARQVTALLEAQAAAAQAETVED